MKKRIVFGYTILFVTGTINNSYIGINEDEIISIQIEKECFHGMVREPSFICKKWD
ncbi:MAG: hypothetical protein ABS916_00120 [Carnobacterium sp.]|uniref:hypothetical protein n=1 Tax=Carnobacterium sp. TaxID=48221 RepID=UPI0033161B36